MRTGKGIATAVAIVGRVLAGAGVMGWAASGEVGAAEEAEQSPRPIRVLLPSSFDAPRTALDMIMATPGFEFFDGAGRGVLGRQRVNVLVDNRPAGAAGVSPRDALRRIRAGDVIRIELMTTGADSSGAPMPEMLNVVTRRSPTSLRWSWTPQQTTGLSARLDRAEVAAAIAGDPWRIDFELAHSGREGRSTGPELLYDRTGGVSEERTEDERSAGDRTEASILLGHSAFGRSSSTLRLSAARAADDRLENSIRVRNTSRSLSTFGTDGVVETLNATLGHERSLGAGEFRATAAYSGSETARRSRRTFGPFDAATPASISDTFVTRAFDELSLRSDYSFQDGASDWQVFAEVSERFLKSETTRTSGSVSGSTVAQKPTDTVSVHDVRMRLAVRHEILLSDDMLIESSIGMDDLSYDWSSLGGGRRNFLQPAGFTQVSWRPNESWRTSLRVERAINRLVLDDFVPTVDLSEDLDELSEANATLVPEKYWESRLSANRDLGRNAAIQMSVFARETEDFRSRIVLSRTIGARGQVTVIEGAGNIPRAVAYGVDLSGQFTLAQLGLPRTSLQWAAALRDSDLLDPVTGSERQISGERTSRLSAAFRQGLSGGDWTWGASYASERYAPRFTATRAYYRSEASGLLGLFLETGDLAGMRFRLDVGNLLDSNQRTTQVVHAGALSDPVRNVEDRTRRSGVTVDLALSRRL